MELLTVQETAQILRVAPITVRRYIASGRLAAVRIGRGVRIRREEIEGMLTPMATRPLPPHLRDDEEDDLSIPEGTPLTRNNSLFRVIDLVDSDHLQEGEPPSPPVDDAEETPQHFLLRVAAIGDELAAAGEPSDIASDKYPYLAEIYAPSNE